MADLTSLEKNNQLNPTTKEGDKVPCKECGKGIYIPVNPQAEINHGFKCSHCSTHVNFDFADVIVE